MVNRTRQILKKAVVTAMGASLVVSGSSTAFAAGSYQETEKTALANVVSKLPEAWDGYLENYQKACKGTKGTFTLTVEDTGRALGPVRLWEAPMFPGFRVLLLTVILPSKMVWKPLSVDCF